MQHAYSMLDSVLQSMQEAFKWTQGQPKAYQSSPAACRHFCGSCGCQLIFEEKDPAGLDYSITTATLDEPDVVHPTVHIFCSTHLKWLGIRDELPHFKEDRNSERV